MKKHLSKILLIAIVIIVTSNNSGDVFASFDDPPPPSDMCGSSSINYSYIYLDDYVDCNLETFGDEDWLKFTAPRDIQISIYSTGTTNVKVYVYESSNLSSHIAYNNDATGTGTHFTSGNNFYTEFYAESGKTYYLKVKGYYSSTQGSYAVYMDSCECVEDVSYYMSLYSSVDAGNSIHYDMNSLYSSEILYSIDQWNKMKTINISPDTSSTIKDLHFYDYYEDDDAANDYAVAYTHYRPLLEDKIMINTYFFEGQTQSSTWNNYWGSFEGRTKTVMHEIGHALGINMDGNSAYKLFFYPDWEEYLGNENDYNLMIQGIPPITLYSPGPCDRDAYRWRWDEH